MTYDILNWMSLVDDSKKLSELSIPGTHDSASIKQESLSIRLTTQTRDLRAQLDAGVRFLDLRCRYINKTFRLYHEKTDLNIGFGTARDICKQFLAEHPRETIIVSVKEESSQSGNNPNVTFQRKFDEYVRKSPASLWYLSNAIPTLGEVRGKLVLFRQFALDKTTTTPRGINAYDGYPSNKRGTIKGPPKLEIQDDYGLLLTAITSKWKAVRKLLDDASAPGSDQDVLYVNFTSAAGINKEDFPVNAARTINPQLHTYLVRKDQGRFGILVRDFEGSDNTNRLIAHANVPYNVVRHFFLKSKRDGDVVDVANESRTGGAPLIAYPAKKAAPDNQLWELVLSHTPPYFFIVSKQTGKVIDVEDANQAPGTPLVAFRRKRSGTDNQLWMLVPADDTGQYFFITSKLKSGVITLQGPKQKAGTPLVVSPQETSQTNRQLWSLVRSG